MDAGHCIGMEKLCQCLDRRDGNALNTPNSIERIQPRMMAAKFNGSPKATIIEGVSSDQRIVTSKIRLGLRKKPTRTATTKHYDWALLNNRDIRDKYVLELRNRFETLKEKTEKGTPNDEYVNFVNAHLEAAAKCIPTKPRTKYRVPWETVAVREKRAPVKTASKSYRKNPTHSNARKLKKAQYQLAGIYLKEQAEYIQNQIDKIRDSVEDRQSLIAWQTINEVSRRKSTAKANWKLQINKK